MQPAESIRDRFRKLIDRLADKTVADEVSWIAGNEDRCFQANFASFSVEIEFSPARENYYIRLYDKDGQVIESINAKHLDGDYQDRVKGPYDENDQFIEALNAKNPDGDYQARVRELYVAARRKALNIDKAFDDILAALA